MKTMQIMTVASSAKKPLISSTKLNELCIWRKRGIYDISICLLCFKVCVAVKVV